MYMFRTRLASFMAGFAAASAVSFYLLQKEIQTGHHFLAEQAQKSYANLESRISHLENIIEPSHEHERIQSVHHEATDEAKHHLEENVALQQ